MTAHLPFTASAAADVDDRLVAGVGERGPERRAAQA